MHTFQTKHFGTLSFETQSELEFPRGVPGFENCRRFLAVRLAESDPLIYLQSLEDPQLCFITLPILAVDPDYRLNIDAEDLASIELASDRQPRIGEDVACLTIISVHESGPTANLLAPVVMNIQNRKAVQAVSADSGYSHRHELVAEEAAVCS